ncbi:MAG: DUF1579 domain-containing protein [Bdellovibrionales bacterium]|nr:DUF1579 domain-containing protein [Bdellovibrionales bacterium]
MKRFLVLAVVSFLLLGCSKNNPQNNFTPEEIEAAWLKASNPGDKHKLLEPFVGTWNADITWWGEADGVPIKSSAESRKAWILGGRFIRQDFEGVTFGEHLTGTGITGYDNLRERFVAMWTDSMSTAIMISMGTVNDTGNKFEFHGDFMDPVTREVKHSRSEVVVNNHNQHTFTAYESAPNGKEYKSVEIVYTRIN